MPGDLALTVRYLRGPRTIYISSKKPITIGKVTKSNASFELFTLHGSESYAFIAPMLQFNSDGGVAKIDVTLAQLLVAAIRHESEVDVKITNTTGKRLLMNYSRRSVDVRKQWQSLDSIFPPTPPSGGRRKELSILVDCMKRHGFMQTMISSAFPNIGSMVSFADRFLSKPVRKTLGFDGSSKVWVSCADHLLMCSGVLDQRQRNGLIMLAQSSPSAECGIVGAELCPADSPMHRSTQASKNVTSHVLATPEDILEAEPGAFPPGKFVVLPFDGEQYVLLGTALSLFITLLTTPCLRIEIAHKVNGTAHKMSWRSLTRMISTAGEVLVLTGCFTSAAFTAEGVPFQMLIRAACDTRIQSVDFSHDIPPDTVVSHGNDSMPLIIQRCQYGKESPFTTMESIMVDARDECVRKYSVDPLFGSKQAYSLLFHVARVAASGR